MTCPIPFQTRIFAPTVDEEFVPTGGARGTAARKRSPNFQVGVGGRSRRKRPTAGSIGQGPPEPAGCATASRIATALPSLKAGALFCR